VPSKKLQSIQYLRAIAALMVAYFHLCSQIESYAPALTGPAWLGVAQFPAGVDIFFVISGFIMVVTSQKLTAEIFLWRRLIRIIPLYWITTLALVIVALFMPGLFKETRPTLLDTVRSLLFIGFHNAAQQGKVVPLLVPGWTLNLEMCFYAVFTVTLFAAIRRWQLWIVGILFLALLLIGPTVSDHDSVVLFYTQPRIFEFFIGMAIGRLSLADKLRAPVPVAYGLCALGFVLTLTVPRYLPDYPITFMVGPALCVVGAVCAERRGGMPNLPFLELLGDASYSIYLTHIFTHGVTRTIWGALPVGSSAAAVIGFAVFSMCSVVAVALLSYRFIETPTLKWLQGVGARHRPARSIAASS
jgi:exopolysaccharide production protein ExoZ